MRTKSEEIQTDKNSEVVTAKVTTIQKPVILITSISGCCC